MFFNRPCNSLTAKSVYNAKYLCHIYDVNKNQNNKAMKHKAMKHNKAVNNEAMNTMVYNMLIICFTVINWCLFDCLLIVSFH